MELYKVSNMIIKTIELKGLNYKQVREVLDMTIRKLENNMLHNKVKQETSCRQNKTVSNLETQAIAPTPDSEYHFLEADR